MMVFGEENRKKVLRGKLEASTFTLFSLDWNDRAYLDGNTFGSMDNHNDWQAPRFVFSVSEITINLKLSINVYHLTDVFFLSSS